MLVYLGTPNGLPYYINSWDYTYSHKSLFFSFQKLIQQNYSDPKIASEMPVPHSLGK